MPPLGGHVTAVLDKTYEAEDGVEKSSDEMSASLALLWMCDSIWGVYRR